MQGILGIGLTSCLGNFEVIHLNNALPYYQAVQETMPDEEVKMIHFAHLNAADLRGNTPFLFEFISKQEAREHAKSLADFMLKEKIDLISLNEVDYAGTVKTGGFDQPKLIAEYLGSPYDYVVFDQYMKSPLWTTGNGAVSLFPMRAVHRHLYGDDPHKPDTRLDYMFKDFIHTEIAVGNKKIDLISTHFDDSSYDFRRKEEAIELADYVRELNQKQPERYILVAGDFNDRHDSETLKIILSSGLYPPQNFGLKTYQNGDPSEDIDHIVASSNIRIDNYRTFAYPWSDHLGLMCELEFLE